MTEEQVDQQILELQRRARTAVDAGAILVQLGNLCLRHHRLDEALSAFRQVIDSGRGSAVLRFNYGWFAKQAGRPHLALDQYAKALALGIKQPEEVHLNRANVYSELLLDSTSALKELEAALKLNPGYFPAWLNLGNLYEQMGRVHESRAAFIRALEIDPSSSSALARLADSHDFSVDSERTRSLKNSLLGFSRTTRDPDLYIALGRAAEQQGLYEEAWDHYRSANAIDRSSWPPYNRESIDQLVSAIIETCDESWLQKKSSSQVFSPIFICGSFRSGSTLLEQILAAHSAFVPGGEQEFFPRLVDRYFPHYPTDLSTVSPSRLAAWGNTYRSQIHVPIKKGSLFTDKRPDNIFYLGLIKAMFPKAKILVTLRDWRDTAISIFGTRLAPRFSYATDIADIHHQLQAQARLITHWAQLFKDDMAIVNYERLVDSPQATLGPILRGYGLNWEDSCLNFHKSDRPVRTASVLQVRSPMNKNSVERWRRFERCVPAGMFD